MCGAKSAEGEVDKIKTNEADHDVVQSRRDRDGNFVKREPGQRRARFQTNYWSLLFPQMSAMFQEQTSRK